MTNAFIHYGDRPVTKLRPAKQGGRGEVLPYKPEGLWFSHGGTDGWRKWCEDADFGCGSVATEVVLCGNAKILRISSAEDLLAFDRAWCSEVAIGKYTMRSPDWVRIAESYDGIIIDPYQWSMRFELRWYYGWDCASGIVWHPRAVESLRELQPQAQEN